MAFAPIPEYEGKSPYVFISYAQQDERIAYSIAVKMYNEGFRLWSSAACGNPSSMRIAERLSNSAVAMVFLSKSYLKFASSREFEPRAVMNSPKQKIVILLDDTPMGTDWNAVDFPAGIRYNPDVPQGLWLRINSSDALEKCRGAWPKRPMPEPSDERPKADLSVDEDELTDEMQHLNSVMRSFDAGLDEDEINNISLFRRNDPAQDQFRWPPKSEPSQEQEYYSIENLMTNSPMPIPPEKKQYDSMLGLIESFMEKSSRAKEEEQRRSREEGESAGRRRRMPISENTYGEYRAVPKNEFDSVDLSKDTSSSPVVITESSAPSPITLDYGEETEIAAYSMTRSRDRADRVSEIIYYSSNRQQPEAQPVYNEVSSNENKPAPSKQEMQKQEPKAAAPGDPVFEKIVDDRKFIKSTDDNIDGAKLTYHLGSLFDGFDESDFAQDEPEPPKQEPPKPVQPPVAEKPPARFTDDDIPLPTLSFEPKRPQPIFDFAEERPKPPVTPPVTPPAPPPRRTLSKPRRRFIVSVRRGIRHIEYDDEMYEVNGRWIPGHIYHRIMPGAKYTNIRRITRKTVQEPAQPPVFPTRPAAALTSDSSLHSAVNTFFTPSSVSDGIPEGVKSALRERHEVRRNEAIRQLEEAQAASHPAASSVRKEPPEADGENTPARKHRFSHEGGIKKSLMANMETPVNRDVEESHRQYGARAEAAAEAASRPEPEEKKSKEKKSKEKSSGKDDEKAAKKAAKKAAEKAAQKKAESKKNDKKGKDKGKDKKPENQTTPEQIHPPTAASAFADVDEDSLIEMPKQNLPGLRLDPTAYSSMNLSEILFGENKGAGKDQKKKKKK